MNHRLLRSEGSSRLILIFAGWAVDDIMFRNVSFPGYDVVVVWDFSSFHIDWSFTEKYDEICLFAWSFGVYVASQTVQAIDSRITLRVAVNGTVTPVDSMYGITEDRFFRLLDDMSLTSVDKAFGDMAIDADELAHINSLRPSRTLAQYKAELQAIADRTILDTPSDIRWDIAVISRHDVFFPRFSQIRAWQRTSADIICVNRAHFVDFASLIRNFIADKSFFDDVKPAVKADAVERLLRLIGLCHLAPVLGDAKNDILEIGARDGLLSRRIAAFIRDARLVMWNSFYTRLPQLPPARGAHLEICPLESSLARLRPGSVDHIFSAFQLHRFNSLEGFLLNSFRALRPDGYVFIITFTSGNLHELYDSDRLPTPQQWIERARRYFEVVASEDYIRDLDFETPQQALDGFRNHKTDIPMRLDGLYHITYRPFIIILHKK